MMKKEDFMKSSPSKTASTKRKLNPTGVYSWNSSTNIDTEFDGSTFPSMSGKGKYDHKVNTKLLAISNSNDEDEEASSYLSTQMNLD